MRTNLVPFNLGLLVLSANDLKSLIAIRTLDTFEGSSKNFHPFGLFSTEIFGKVGDERRSRRFAYMDLKVDIFHPVIYKALCDLKQLHGEIIAGTSYAVFDKQTKSFIKSEPGQGDTGFAYFMKHFDELVFEERESTERLFNIKLVQKYREKNEAVMSKLIVMPAGLRDFEVDAAGKPSVHEINTFYKRAFSVANVISEASLINNPESIDRNRFALQRTVCELYEYIISLLEGKKKHYLGKYASRTVYNGTRNVITTTNYNIDHLNDENNINSYNTIVGLFQFLKGTLPLAIHHIREGFLSKVFSGANAPMYLVNKKTLKRELVEIDPNLFDEWMTVEGLEKVIARYGEEDMRHLPLETETHYFGLTYRSPNTEKTKYFSLLQDIEQVANMPTKDPKHVTPMTFVELMYASVYRFANRIPWFVTRYPVSGYGSIFASMVYLKSTTKGEVRKELDGETGEELYQTDASEFPIPGEQFMNSMALPSKHLARAAADFDM